MARSRYCRVCSEFHDLEESWPEACIGHFGTVSKGAAPYIRPDGMDAIESPVNGMLYDSRSAYYRSIKAAGCEIVGNERPQRRSTPMPSVRTDIRRAIEQLNSR